MLFGSLPAAKSPRPTASDASKSKSAGTESPVEAATYRASDKTCIGRTSCSLHLGTPLDGIPIPHVLSIHFMDRAESLINRLRHHVLFIY